MMDDDAASRKKRNPYPTGNQKTELIQFVEDHCTDLFGKSVNGFLVQTLWAYITNKLNSLGPNKDTEGWKRCFVAMKSAAKEKLRKAGALNAGDRKIIKMFRMDQLNKMSLNEYIKNQSSQIRNDRSTENETDVMDLIKTNQHPQSLPVLLNEQECSVSPIQQLELMLLNQNSSVTQPLTTTQIQQEDNRPTEAISAAEIVGTESQRGRSSKVGVPTKSQKYIHSTPLQKMQLVQLVGKNYSGLFGRDSNGPNGDTIKKKIWKTIMQRLNAMGPDKDVAFWKRSFSALKSSVKEKLKNDLQSKKKNGKNYKPIELNDLERAIVGMFGKEALAGSKRLGELGLQKHANQVFKSTSYQENDPAMLGNTVPISLASPVTIDVSYGNGEISDSLTIPTQCERDQDRSSLTNPTATNATISRAVSNQQCSGQGLNIKSLFMSSPTSVAATNQLVIATSTSVQCEQDEGRSSLTNPTATDATISRVVLNEQCDGQGRDSPSLLMSSPTSAAATNQSVTATSTSVQGQRRPQRRGIEINLTRFVEQRRVLTDPNVYDSESDRRRGVDDSESDRRRYRRGRNRRQRRRNRLSVPLGVMATEALAEQKKTNALLAELLLEIRNR